MSGRFNLLSAITVAVAVLISATIFTSAFVSPCSETMISKGTLVYHRADLTPGIIHRCYGDIYKVSTSRGLVLWPKEVIKR